MDRKQFTFYGSFYRAMRKITNKKTRSDIYDSISAYALYGTEPDEDVIHPVALMMFEMAKPVLDTARRKADGASVKDNDKIEEGSKKDEEKRKLRAKKKDDREKEKENEIEKELEIEHECDGARESFDIFWNNFPKKVDKKGARIAFEEVDVPLEVLLRGLDRQKRSAQWLEEGGRYVPLAATWLRNQRWEDELPAGKSVPMGASGQLGEAEMTAIKRMLEEE